MGNQLNVRLMSHDATSSCSQRTKSKYFAELAEEKQTVVSLLWYRDRSSHSEWFDTSGIDAIQDDGNKHAGRELETGGNRQLAYGGEKIILEEKRKAEDKREKIITTQTVACRSAPKKSKWRFPGCGDCWFRIGCLFLLFAMWSEQLGVSRGMSRCV